MKKGNRFYFKNFEILHEKSAMKVGTDGVLLGAWAEVKNAGTILDIGSGTGLIAIIMAQKNEIAHIDAVELDLESYKEMQINFSNCPWKERITAYHGAIQDFSKKTEQKYDLIISNPPYFNNSLKSFNLSLKNARHTDTLSYKDLLEVVENLLKPLGSFSVILPFAEAIIFKKLAESFKLYPQKILEVTSFDNKPVERVLISFVRNIGKIENTSLIIYKDISKYSEEYKKLTWDFYLFNTNSKS